MGPLIMLYHIELFEYTLITILFTIYLTFGIGMAKFLGFQNRGFVREKFTTNLCFWAKLWRISIPLSLAPCPYTPLAPLYLNLTHFEQEATRHHAKPKEAEILCREGLAPSVGLIILWKVNTIKSSFFNANQFLNS